MHNRWLKTTISLTCGVCMAAMLISNFIHHILPHDVSSLTRALGYFVPLVGIPAVILACWGWEKRRWHARLKG